LRIIKIAMNADHFQIGSVFRHHLQTLYIRGAAIRIHAGDAHILFVFESFQRRRAGVATGGYQYQIIFIALLRQR